MFSEHFVDVEVHRVPFACATGDGNDAVEPIEGWVRGLEAIAVRK